MALERIFLDPPVHIHWPPTQDDEKLLAAAMRIATAREVLPKTRVDITPPDAVDHYEAESNAGNGGTVYIRRREEMWETVIAWWDGMMGRGGGRMPLAVEIIHIPENESEVPIGRRHSVLSQPVIPTLGQKLFQLGETMEVVSVVRSAKQSFVE